MKDLVERLPSDLAMHQNAALRRVIDLPAFGAARRATLIIVKIRPPRDQGAALPSPFVRIGSVRKDRGKVFLDGCGGWCLNGPPCLAAALLDDDYWYVDDATRLNGGDGLTEWLSMPISVTLSLSFPAACNAFSNRE